MSQEEIKRADAIASSCALLSEIRKKYASAYARKNNGRGWQRLQPRFFEHNQNYVPQYFRGLDPEKIVDKNFQALKEEYDDSRHKYLTLVAEHTGASAREASEKAEKWSVYWGRFGVIDKAAMALGAGVVGTAVVAPAAVVGIGTYRFLAGIVGSTVVGGLMYLLGLHKDTPATLDARSSLEKKWAEAKNQRQTYETFQENNRKALRSVSRNMWIDRGLRSFAIALGGFGAFTVSGLRATAFDAVATAGNEFFGNKWGTFFVYGHDTIGKGVREVGKFAVAALTGVLPVLENIWQELFGVRGAQAAEKRYDSIHYEKIETGRFSSAGEFLSAVQVYHDHNGFLIREDDGTYTAMTIEGRKGTDLHIAGDSIRSAKYARITVPVVIISRSEYMELLPFFDRWWASAEFFFTKYIYEFKSNATNEPFGTLGAVRSNLFAMEVGFYNMNLRPEEYFERLHERARTLPTLRVQLDDGRIIETAVNVGEVHDGQKGLRREGLEKLASVLIDERKDRPGMNSQGKLYWDFDDKEYGAPDRKRILKLRTNWSSQPEWRKTLILAHELGHAISATINGPGGLRGGLHSFEGLFNKLPVTERALILGELNEMHSELRALQERAMADRTWNRMTDEEKLRIATGYKHGRNVPEVLGDCIAKYLTHPEYVNAKAPHFAEFLRELVNNHPGLSRALVLP